MVSELEITAVLEGQVKPTVAPRVDKANNYLGGAFIGASRNDCWRVRAKSGTVAKGWKRTPRQMAGDRRHRYSASLGGRTLSDTLRLKRSWANSTESMDR
jgi:hypothetical protein